MSDLIFYTFIVCLVLLIVVFVFLIDKYIIKKTFKYLFYALLGLFWLLSIFSVFYFTFPSIVVLSDLSKDVDSNATWFLLQLEVHNTFNIDVKGLNYRKFLYLDWWKGNVSLFVPLPEKSNHYTISLSDEWNREYSKNITIMQNNKTFKQPSFKILNDLSKESKSENYTLMIEVQNVTSLDIEDLDDFKKNFSLSWVKQIVSVDVPLKQQYVNLFYIIVEKWTTLEKRERISLDREETLTEKNNYEKEKKQKSLIEMRTNPERYVEILKDSWYVWGFDNVAIHSFSLKNNSNLIYKNIKLVATYYSASNTLLRSNEKIIYDVIWPWETKKFTDFNFWLIPDQVDSSQLKVVAVVIEN